MVKYYFKCVDCCKVDSTLDKDLGIKPLSVSLYDEVVLQAMSISIYVEYAETLDEFNLNALKNAMSNMGYEYIRTEV